MRRYGGKQGIVQEMLLGVVLIFVVIILFIFGGILLSGSGNGVLTFALSLGNTALNTFEGSYWQGAILVFSGGLVFVVIGLFAYMGFAANREEPSE